MLIRTGDCKSIRGNTSTRRSLDCSLSSRCFAVSTIFLLRILNHYNSSLWKAVLSLAEKRKKRFSELPFSSRMTIVLHSRTTSG